MINKEDIKVGTLVKHVVILRGNPELRIKKVEKINEKTFKLMGDWDNVKYTESEDYSILTDEEYKKLYESAFDAACRKNMKSVYEMVRNLVLIKDGVDDIQSISQQTGLNYSIDITPVLTKLDGILDRLKKELGE